MRFSSIVLVLGAVSCTLGAAIPAPAKDATPAKAPAPAKDASPAKDAAPVKGATPAKGGALDKDKDTAPVAEVKPLPFDSAKAEKIVAEIKKEEPEIKAFLDKAKDLDKIDISKVKEGPADGKAGDDKNAKTPADKNAKTPAEKPKTPTKEAPKLFRRDVCRSHASNMRVHIRAMADAERAYDQANQRLRASVAKLQQYDAAIRHAQNPQWERPSQSEIARQVASLNRQRNDEISRNYNPAGLERNRQAEIRRRAATMLVEDKRTCESHQFARQCGMPAEIQRMIHDYINERYLNTLISNSL